MPGNEEKWSFVGSPIECAEPDCGMSALTTCQFCWEHLPEDQKEGFVEKIERLAEERRGHLQVFILQGAVLYEVKLKKAKLAEADLQKADLTGANLQGTDLSSIEYDAKTSFIATDIRNIDWSKNPHLERHIKDQQWLHDFKQRAKRSNKLRILGFLWRLTCDYGRSFWRWMTWSLGLAGLFGFLYADYGWYNWFSRWPALSGLLKTINPSIHVNPLGADNWFTPYYYSIVTFTTLGFGDVIPANYSAQIIITIEVLLGYFMLGGLISILANYLARRS